MEEIKSPTATNPTEHKNKLYLKLISPFVIIISLLMVLYIALSNKFNLQSVQNNKIFSDTTHRDESENIKQKLLQSESISLITLGAELGFIPVENIENDYGSGNYEFNFSYCRLTPEQQLKLAKIFYEGSPSSLFLLKNDDVYLSSNRWLIYHESEGENIAVRDGFACYVFPEDYKSPALCSTDGKCIYPRSDFGCARIIKTSTYNKLSSQDFLKETLKNAGIDCNECKFEDIKRSFRVPQFSRRDVYFSKIDVPDKDIVENELQKSVSDYNVAGWTTITDDNTITEASSSGNYKVIVSKRISAENSKASCSHEITLFEKPNKVYEKREMIGCSLKLEYGDNHLRNY